MIKLENLSKKFNLQDHDLLDKIAESLNQKIIGETYNIQFNHNLRMKLKYSQNNCPAFRDVFIFVFSLI